MRLWILLAVLVAFTVFSTVVTVEHGYFGFLGVAAGSDWGLQVFLDLSIAIALFSVWMSKDARVHGIARLPYFIGLLTLGSISALAYLLHRELKQRSTTTTATT